MERVNFYPLVWGGGCCFCDGWLCWCQYDGRGEWARWVERANIYRACFWRVIRQVDFCNRKLFIMLLKKNSVWRNIKEWTFDGSNTYGSRVVFAGEGLWVCEVSIFLFGIDNWKGFDLSKNQNIFFFPRGLPFHSFIFCYGVFVFILHSCCHALGFWICMMNECKLNFVGVATWLFATPVCDSVLRPDHPNLSSQFGHFVGAKAPFA